MKFKTHNDVIIPVDGTYLIGEIETNYERLFEVFGQPLDGDGYKTDAVWEILFEDKTVATVYNWKNGKGYLGDEGMEVADIKDWHVGGRSPKALTYVSQAVK